VRILLVEGEPRAAQMLAKGLREEAYVVDVVGDFAVYVRGVFDRPHDRVPRSGCLAITCAAAGSASTRAVRIEIRIPTMVGSIHDDCEFITGSSSKRQTNALMRLACRVLLLCALASPLRAQTPATVAVSGIVQDQTGAVLPAATVALVNSAGTTVQSVAADAAGAFRFERVAPGQYELRAGYEGFQPATVKLRVGTRPPPVQRLVLDLAALAQEITVSNAVTAVSTAAGSNVDAITVARRPSSWMQAPARSWRRSPMGRASTRSVGIRRRNSSTFRTAARATSPSSIRTRLTSIRWSQLLGVELSIDDLSVANPNCATVNELALLAFGPTMFRPTLCCRPANDASFSAWTNAARLFQHDRHLLSRPIPSGDSGRLHRNLTTPRAALRVI
jgi:hypothetical protein